MNDIWTPTGMKYLGGQPVARTGETGEMAHEHAAVWECPKCHERHEIRAVTEEDVPDAQLEDIFGWQMEKSWEKHVVEFHQRLGSRLTPKQVGQNRDVRAEMAGALREYRAGKAKMAQSANNRIFFPTA